MKIPSLPRKLKIFIITVASLLLIYTLVGFLLLPALALNQLPKLSAEHLQRAMRIEDIRFNPYSMELTVDGFVLDNKDDSTFSSFERFYVNLGVWQSIKDLTLTVDEVTLTKPYAFVRRDKQGDFNFSDLLEGDKSEPEQPKDNGEPFPVTIGQIGIVQGKVTWEDNFYPEGQREDIYPLDLKLRGLTTRVSGKSDLGFSVAFASGGSLTWKGSLGLNPLFSEGHINLERVSLHRLWQLGLKNYVHFVLAKGKKTVVADYNLRDTKSGLSFKIDNARIEIKDLQIADKSDPTPVITLPNVAVSGIRFDLQKQTVRIAEFASADAVFKAWLNADGTINYQSLFAGKTEETAAQPAKAAADAPQEKPWLITLDRLGLKNYTLNFVDKTQTQPVPIDLTAITFNSKDLSSKAGTDVPIELNMIVNKDGRIALSGNAVLDPFKADLKLKADAIAINDYQTYIDQAANLDIVSGLFGADINIALAQQDDQNMSIGLRGDTRIDDFVSKERVSNHDFLKWKQLRLEKMNLDLAANRFLIETVALDRPYSRVLIRKDKSSNISDVVVDKQGGAKAEAAPSGKVEKPEQSQAPQPTFKIGRVNISEGVSDFSDLSLILPFSAHIVGLKGAIDDISSAKEDTAKIKLNGKVGDIAPVSIEGKINPYSGESQFALDFRGMPMPIITPYMAEFAGRKIEKGNLTLGLRYQINKSQLTASNNLLIDHLVLGEEVENPKAVSLPLDLAIALLEDSDNKIKLDVPITGSLEDPQFSVASIIVDALVNVITKIVTSPFNAIASLIDGGGDISQVVFAAGQAELSGDERGKLEQLAAALEQRPKLHLEIRGTAFTGFDWPKLQDEALTNKLKAIRAKELKKESGRKVRAEEIELNDEDYQRLLADLFIERYPQLGERSLFGTPKLLKPETGDFYEVARNKLAADLPPDPVRLRDLATDRARAIVKFMSAQGIAVDRMYLLDAQVDPEENGPEPASILNLAVN